MSSDSKSYLALKRVVLLKLSRSFQSSSKHLFIQLSSLFSKKCNSITDCHDKSDELDCKFVIVDKSYLKDVPPLGREPGVKPMEVLVSAYVVSIINVDTMDLKFTLDFTITTEWYDDRLQFRDLNENHVLNSVAKEDIKEMWTPLIVFSNAMGNILLCK